MVVDVFVCVFVCPTGRYDVGVRSRDVFGTQTKRVTSQWLAGLPAKNRSDQYWGVPGVHWDQMRLPEVGCELSLPGEFIGPFIV